MRTEEILTALRRLKVETGSLACMGCGREHDAASTAAASCGMPRI